jgi:very-short-patch-repair endonuclease
VPIKQVKRARQLRRQMSLPEVLLWQQLRKRPDGLKFRKQFPIGEMTVDFSCLERRLIVEVDGKGHSYGDQPRRDAARDALLWREGFLVLRIAARDVLRNMDGVLRLISATCSEVGPLHHPPSPSAAADGPPPRPGEDLR